MAIHATAQIDPGARIATDVEVGPFCVIGPDVEIGAGTKIGAHVLVEAGTRIGRDNQIHAFSSIGGAPQDKKYHDEPTRLEIGDRNTIREFCTINRGTVQDAGVTRIGNDNWIMAYVHFAHDCQIGNNAIFANLAQIAGHVSVGDWAILGGNTQAHQFVQIGAHSFTGMGTYLAQDLPPYVTAAGNMARPFGINKEGLKRRGFSSEAIAGLKRAYKTLYRKGLTLEEALAELKAQAAACREVQPLLDFIARSKRGIIR